MSPSFPELEEDWREVLALQPRAVVFFWAAWSPPDLMMWQVLKRVAPEFEEQFAFFSADLDDEDVVSLATQAGVSTNPNLTFFRNGQARKHTIGYLTADALRQKLNEWLVLD